MSKKETKAINIIYHDENFFQYYKSIIEDCQEIIKTTKGNLILTKNLEQLELLLKLISLYAPKTQYVLIMNGGSSDRVSSFIKKKNYKKYFIKACIYCNSLKKYQNVMETHKDFIGNLSVDCKSIIAFIKYSYDTIPYNENIDFDNIINYYSYSIDYFSLHQTIAKYYLNSQLIDVSKFNSSINNVNINNKDEIFIKLYDFYNSFKNNTSKEFIFNYLKKDNLSSLLNQLLIKNNQTDFDKISYFVGNLMYRIVQYGNEEKKGVTKAQKFYKGIQLNIFNLFEFIKSEGLLISFSHFMMISAKKELALINSRRNLHLMNRKDKSLFSAMLNIDYLYDDGYQPSIFDLNNLIPYPDEEEFIVLPFTFFYVKSIKYDILKMNVDIDLEVIGKFEILEEKVKIGKKIIFDDKSHAIISN